MEKQKTILKGKAIFYRHAHKPGHRALRKGRVSLPNHVYTVSTTTAGRQRVFLDFRSACAACRYFEAGSIIGDARMLAWVLMPDHAH